MLFKGPYHVDALMRVPLVWRPAEVAGIAAAEIEEPVGHIDLVATFCEIAGVPVPEWNEGAALPKVRGSDRERVLTEWDCEHRGTTTFIRSIYRDGWLCSAYEKGTLYEGTEGELYDLRNDPHQFENRWDDAEAAGMKGDLVADLYDHLPAPPDSKRAWESPV